MDRRTFLRGAAGVSLALPLWASSSHTARAAPAPKRLVLFYSGNGTVPDVWTPSGGETNFVLKEILAPLEPFRDQLMVLDGVDNVAADNSSGSNHQTGMGSLWTGTELTDEALFDSGNGKPAGWGGGPSVDQAIADAIHASAMTKFKSLELGVQVGKTVTVAARMIYKGASQPVPSQDDPKKAFDTLFTDLSADPQDLAKLRAERKTVLDAVKAQMSTLEGRLGAADRARLDQHLTAVGEVEQQILSTSGALGGSCQLPTDPGNVDPFALNAFPAVGKLQMDVLHMALACDLTRVASLQWNRAVGQIVPTWADPSIKEAHHSLSHEPLTNAASKQKLVQINRWYAEQLAYFCDKLQKTPEGSGTMLDNTVIVWGNEIAVGQTHSHKRIPFVMVGSCGGYFKTGRYLKYGGVPHNGLLVALSNAMGANVSHFGNAAYGSGELAGLTA